MILVAIVYMIGKSSDKKLATNPLRLVTAASSSMMEGIRNISTPEVEDQKEVQITNNNYFPAPQVTTTPNVIYSGVAGINCSYVNAYYRQALRAKEQNTVAYNRYQADPSKINCNEYRNARYNERAHINNYNIVRRACGYYSPEVEPNNYPNVTISQCLS